MRKFKAFGLALLVSLFSISLAFAKDMIISDTVIKTKILTAYTLNTQLNPFDIDVKVDHSIVTLNGSVTSNAEKDLAADIARGVEEVKEVVNNISVDINTKKHSKKSNFMQTVDDASITATIKSKLMLNKHTSSLNIHVKTQEGIVNLEGDVHSVTEKQTAERIANHVKGVTQVVNNLKLLD